LQSKLAQQGDNGTGTGAGGGTGESGALDNGIGSVSASGTRLSMAKPGPGVRQVHGGMSTFDSMEDFEPIIKTQLSQKTLDIVTNLGHTKYNSRALPRPNVELFPPPVVDMSREEAEEVSFLLAEPCGYVCT